MFAALPLATALLAALQTSAAEREPGLTLRLFQLPFAPDVLPELAPNQTPNVDRRIDRLAVSGDEFGALPAPHLTQALGWLVVSEPGEYRLRLTSDDGSRLFLDGARRIDNDGRHGMQAVTSAPLRLEAGEHALRVEHFDSGGGRGLRLEWLTPGAADFATVPTSALACEVDPTRVTSPGTKAVIDDRRPGLGLPVDGVHPGWRVETLRPEGFEPRVGSLCFLPDGRLAFGTFDPLQRDEERLPDIDSKPPDSIWALDVDSGELQEVATGVYEPSGLCVVGGELYVAHRRAIERLSDRDGDGYFETHEPLAAGWEGWNYHQFTFGLVHREGLLYTALSTSMAPPGWEGMGTNAGPNGPLRGAVLAIDLASGDVSAIAGGTRTPNGLGLVQGRLLYTDNQGAWYPASALHEVRPGRFFGHFNRTNVVPKLGERFPEGGHPSIYSERERAAPVLWLPHGEVVNSPTTPLEIPSGPFEGQVLIGELTAGGVRRAFLEEVEGVLQGALMRFTQGLESGVNRMVWGPGGALYLGGIGAGGNWNWNGTRFGLQRLVPTGGEAFEIESVRATAEGFRVRFTQPVADRDLLDPERYTIESWTYAPSAEYGGPKVDLLEHRLVSLEAQAGNREVLLGVEGLREGRVVHLSFDVESRSKAALWSSECWYTLNRIPRGRPPGTGLGAEPGDAGVWLLARGNGATTAPAERPENLTSEAVVAAQSVALSGGAEPLATRTRIGRKAHPIDLHFEIRRKSEAATARVEWGWAEYLVPGEHLGPEWTAIDIRWHSTGYVREVHFDRGERHSEFKNRVLEGTGGPIGILAPVEFHCDEGEVEVRNAWVREARQQPPTPGPWVDLLADPEAFVVRGGEARFEFEGGTLRGTTAPNTPNTFAVTRSTYGDFELSFEVRVDDAMNSGVQLRSQVQGGIGNRTGGMQGYQCEIDPSPRAWSAGLYEERGRGWLHPMHANPAARRAWKRGAWNRIRVVCRGPVLRTWLNGVPAAEAMDAVRSEGHLGFQVHGVGAREDPLTVEWRDVRLRELR